MPSEEPLRLYNRRPKSLAKLKKINSIYIRNETNEEMFSALVDITVYCIWLFDDEA